MSRTATPDGVLQGIWYEDSAAYRFLLPLSWLYRLVIGIRRRLYERGVLKRIRINRPVIVVGNITVGGTGKTPVTIWLAGQLKGRGMNPGIISRGYGGSLGRHPVRVTADSDPAVVGDEALLMARRSECPVVVHPNRVHAAQDLSMLGAGVVISDDGLQHYRLARQFEIAVIDGTRGFGNGSLLPAGPLREPVSRLESVDRAIVNRSVMHSEGVMHQLPEGLPVSEFFLSGAIARSLDDSEELPLARFAGRQVHAVAAIGNPGRFFAFLETHGMQVIEHALPDHARLTEDDLRYDDGVAILMTEKDAVKCRGFRVDRCWYVPVEVQFDQAQDWLDELCERLSMKSEANPA